ncbi:MAG: glycerol-3-phosphate 1-O-acyltransferase PlsY [Phycisphaeraceae bacterium]
MQFWLLWTVVGYWCGSLPFGYLIARLRGVDIREHGSGNVGATNVGRVLGRKWGALCFILDVLKGLLPVLIAGIVLGYANRGDLARPEAWRWLAVALAAVLGHMFPVWLGFRGGKGVATGLGVLLGLWPIMTLPGVAAGLTWLLLASMYRYVSLASIAAAMALPAYLYIEAVALGLSFAELGPFFIIASLMALLVVVRHRSNIVRLYRGTESMLGSQRT